MSTRNRRFSSAGAQVRLAVLITHPVHYSSALFRRVARDPDIALTVFFGSDISLRAHVDPGFSSRIEWDVPLVEGFDHEILPAWGAGRSPSFWWPFVRGLGARLKGGRFDALWVHGYNRPAHWLAMVSARRLGIPVLIRDDATAISRPRGRLKRLIKPLYFTVLNHLADRFLSVGRLNADHYQELGVPETKIVPVPWAVDNAFFQLEDGSRRAALRRELDIPADVPVILMASRLMRLKNPDVLLAAFQRLNSAAAARRPHLVFVGEGEMLAPLRESARGICGVRFAGFRGQRELRAFYDLCDVFVLPSGFETWGLVVNEAMNLAKPVVVSDRVGAGYDLVRHGENGFVVPVGDADVLATALSEILADPDRARCMGWMSRDIIDRWDFDADLRGLRTALGLPPTCAGGVAE